MKVRRRRCRPCRAAHRGRSRATTDLTVPLIQSAPELALAEVLSQTLKTTTAALMAADPGIFCEPPPPWVPLPPSTRIAERIVSHACQLIDELADYHRAVQLALARQRQRERRTAEQDEIPF